MRRVLVRILVVLLVLAVLLGLAVLLAERLVSQQVDEQVQAQIEKSLSALTDDGEGFATVTTDVQGLALVGLARGSFDTVEVDAADGVVQGVQVESLDLTATGVSSDGSSAQTVEVRVVADPGAALAAIAGPEVADSATVVAEDRLQVTVGIPLPLLPDPVDLLVLIAVSVQPDGGLVVEPVEVSAAGLDLDVSELDQLPRQRIGPEQLPLGLRFTEVVLSGAGEPVVEVSARCDGGCSLRAEPLG